MRTYKATHRPSLQTADTTVVAPTVTTLTPADPTTAATNCWVCGEDDCRSWKHTDTEWEKAKDAWKSKFNNRTKGRFANRFEGRFQQYITECEQGEDNEDSEVENAF
jgi:hypothetical protein